MFTDTQTTILIFAMGGLDVAVVVVLAAVVIVVVGTVGGG